MDVGEVFSWAHWLFSLPCKLLTEMSMVLVHSRELTSTGCEIWTVPDSIHCSAPQSLEAMRIFLAGETSGITMMFVLML